MSEVRRGILQPGSEVFSDENVNPTFRGFVRDLESGSITPVFLKLLDLQKVFVECICAVIGRRVGLPIPHPYIIKVDGHSNLRVAGEVIETIGFGSEDAKFPSLRRRVFNEAVLHRFCRTKLSIAIGVFDEWIMNEDRHIGNILYGGHGSYLFIDHESSGILDKEPTSGTAENFILELVSSSLSDRMKHGARHKAREACDLAKAKKVEDLADLSIAAACVDPQDMDRTIHFLTTRVQHLYDLIGEKIKLTQLELGI